METLAAAWPSTGYSEVMLFVICEATCCRQEAWQSDPQKVPSIHHETIYDRSTRSADHLTTSNHFATPKIVINRTPAVPAVMEITKNCLFTLEVVFALQKSNICFTLMIGGFEWLKCVCSNQTMLSNEFYLWPLLRNPTGTFTNLVCRWWGNIRNMNISFRLRVSKAVIESILKTTCPSVLHVVK